MFTRFTRSKALGLVLGGLLAVTTAVPAFADGWTSPAGATVYRPMPIQRSLPAL